MSREPATIDPTGAPSPFDRQNMTESTLRVISATFSPSAVAALKMRAPSRCTFRPASCASIADFVHLRRRVHRAAGHVVVFSRQTNAVCES